MKFQEEFNTPQGAAKNEKQWKEPEVSELSAQSTKGGFPGPTDETSTASPGS